MNILEFLWRINSENISNDTIECMLANVGFFTVFTQKDKYIKISWLKA